MPTFGLLDRDIIGGPQPTTYHQTEFGLVASGDAGVYLRLYANRTDAEAGGTALTFVRTGAGGRWEYTNDALVVVFLRTPEGDVIEIPAPGIGYGQQGIQTHQMADSAAPGPVESLTGEVTSTTVALHWSNPIDTDIAGVEIRRANGAVAPATVDDGVLVAYASGTTYTNTGLTAATQYSYAVFASDHAGNYSVAASHTATTSA